MTDVLLSVGLYMIALAWFKLSFEFDNDDPTTLGYWALAIVNMLVIAFLILCASAMLIEGIGELSNAS